jgi:hypothetical protein
MILQFELERQLAVSYNFYFSILEIRAYICLEIRFSMSCRCSIPWFLTFPTFLVRIISGSSEKGDYGRSTDAASLLGVEDPLSHVPKIAPGLDAIDFRKEVYVGTLKHSGTHRITPLSVDTAHVVSVLEDIHELFRSQCYTANGAVEWKSGYLSRVAVYEEGSKNDVECMYVFNDESLASINEHFHEKENIDISLDTPRSGTRLHCLSKYSPPRVRKIRPPGQVTSATARLYGLDSAGSMFALLSCYGSQFGVDAGILKIGEYLFRVEGPSGPLQAEALSQTSSLDPSIPSGEQFEFRYNEEDALTFCHHLAQAALSFGDLNARCGIEGISRVQREAEEYADYSQKRNVPDVAWEQATDIHNRGECDSVQQMQRLIGLEFFGNVVTDCSKWMSFSSDFIHFSTLMLPEFVLDSSFPQRISRLFELMQRTHRLGITMQFAETEISTDDSFFRLRTRHLSFFVDVVNRRHAKSDRCIGSGRQNDCPSRLFDFDTLARYFRLRGTPRQLVGWTEFVREFDDYVEHLRWDEDPDYDQWIKKSLNVRWISLREYLESVSDSGAACDLMTNDGLRWLMNDRSLLGLNGEELWTRSGGPLIIKHRASAGTECGEDALTWISLRILSSLDFNEKLTWLRSHIPRDICMSVVRAVGTPDDSISKSPLNFWAFYLAYPEELLGYLELAQFPELPEIPNELVLAFWDMWSKYDPIHREDHRHTALRFVVYIGDTQGIGPGELVSSGLVPQSLCSRATEASIYKSYDFAHLVWMCRKYPPTSEVCDSLKRWALYPVGICKPGPGKNIWISRGCDKLVNLIPDMSGDTACEALAGRGLSTFPISEWNDRSSAHKDVGPYAYAKSSRWHSMYCESLPAKFQSLDTLWICGNPWEKFCSITKLDLEDTFLFATDLWVQPFFDEGPLTSLLEHIDEAPRDCQERMVRYTVGIMGRLHQRGVGLVDISKLAFSIKGFSQISTYYCSDVLKASPEIAIALCPNLPVKLETLHRLVSRVPLEMSVKELILEQKFVFSDSLPMLTCKQTGSDKPEIVEIGAETLIMDEWISVVAEIAMSPVPTGDPAGNLFSKAKDGMYLVPNRGKLDSEGVLDPFVRREYFAFGKLLAMAFIHKVPLKRRLPTFFYAKLLNDEISVDDLYPELADMASKLDGFEELPPGSDEIINAVMPAYAEDMMKAIREGFEVLVPLVSVAERFSPAMLRQFLSIEGRAEIQLRNRDESFILVEEHEDLNFILMGTKTCRVTATRAGIDHRLNEVINFLPREVRLESDELFRCVDRPSETRKVPSGGVKITSDSFPIKVDCMEHGELELKSSDDLPGLFTEDGSVEAVYDPEILKTLRLKAFKEKHNVDELVMSLCRARMANKDGLFDGKKTQWRQEFTERSAMLFIRKLTENEMQLINGWTEAQVQMAELGQLDDNGLIYRCYIGAGDDNFVFRVIDRSYKDIPLEVPKHKYHPGFVEGICGRVCELYEETLDAIMKLDV